eukprot:605242-Prymnesium_polylepis.1
MATASGWTTARRPHPSADTAREGERVASGVNRRPIRARHGAPLPRAQSQRSRVRPRRHRSTGYSTGSCVCIASASLAPLGGSSSSTRPDSSIRAERLAKSESEDETVSAQRRVHAHGRVRRAAPCITRSGAGALMRSRDCHAIRHSRGATYGWRRPRPTWRA